MVVVKRIFNRRQKIEEGLPLLVCCTAVIILPSSTNENTIITYGSMYVIIVLCVCTFVDLIVQCDYV